MRAGVITFHSAHNYGATLQTWALQKALKKLDVTPCVVNYHPECIDRLYRPERITGFAARWKYISRKKVRMRARKLKTKFVCYNRFLNDHLSLAGDYTTYEELKKNPPIFDCYITGSDQVWNTDHTNGFDPAYLLAFAPEGTKKISYAASVGRENFLPQFRESFASELVTFDAVSVREASSADAVREASGKEVSVVLDPTLLLEKEEYEEIKVSREGKERYILVYMMENNRSMIRLANSLSVVTGLPVIQRKPGKIFRNELESFYTHTPGEFLGDIEKADSVLTNSFHGTVFSIIYRRPFVSMLHSETGSRTIDLLKSLGLEKHILKEAKDFKSMGQFDIREQELLDEKIRMLREQSYEFLKNALKK